MTVIEFLNTIDESAGLETLCTLGVVSRDLLKQREMYLYSHSFIGEKLEYRYFMVMGKFKVSRQTAKRAISKMCSTV